MMGAVFQYFAEVTGEKVTAAQARAVARGVLPNSRIVPGYTRGEDGVLVVGPELAPVVREVFQRRDRGAPIVELQAFLLERGIERSVAGVASMLRSRMYLGEIHFGELHNTHAHEPKRVVLKVGQGVAAPQLDCAAQRGECLIWSSRRQQRSALADQPLASLHIELLGPNSQDVATGSSDQPLPVRV